MSRRYQRYQFEEIAPQFSWHLLKMVLGTYLYSLVKIGSVTAEILTLSFCGVGWGVQSHFHVAPNLG